MTVCPRSPSLKVQILGNCICPSSAFLIFPVTVRGNGYCLSVLSPLHDAKTSPLHGKLMGVSQKLTLVIFIWSFAKDQTWLEEKKTKKLSDFGSLGTKLLKILTVSVRTSCHKRIETSISWIPKLKTSELNCADSYSKNETCPTYKIAAFLRV